MGIKTNTFDITSWIFGLLFFVIGLVNLFWGNDQEFGIFIMLLSLAYYPPVGRILKKKAGFSIHGIVKIGLGIFILWAALGVGEFLDKIDIMMIDLNS